MAEASQLLDQLSQAQNVDGGWSYQQGSSWTEPTAFALLALAAHSATRASCLRACAWLRNHQRSDGGWPPHPATDVSTWVTSLALLALPEDALPSARRRGALDWMLHQLKPEPSPLERFIFRAARLTEPQAPGGSPWFPGTAAWIGPTAFSAIALTAAARRDHDPKLLFAARQAKHYLLATRCEDHGWNHGGSKYRSQNAESYPEMTGLALLALDGVPSSELTRSLARAEAFLAAPGSSEALSWLELGLLRHGQTVADSGVHFPCRTTRDVSLRLLALAQWKP